MKLEHIDNLTKWKKSWSNIWSRSISHRLRNYERKKYEIALKNKYLQINIKDRENLLNIWQKVCLLKWWDNLVLLKNWEERILYKENVEFYKSNIKEVESKLTQILKK